MGRPRLHDEETARQLIDAAEQILARDGLDAVSVRSVADIAGTSFRAVYSVFGSKEGLIEALAGRAFQLIEAEFERLPGTDDPVADLVEVAATAFRGFVCEHPSLYRVAFQRVFPRLHATEEMTNARAQGIEAFQGIIRRVEQAGLLGDRTIDQAEVEFDAMCEGLANIELRGELFPLIDEGAGELFWRSAITSLVRGWSA